VAGLLGVMAAGTPGAWAWLWLTVPVVTATAMLVAWRFGVWGLAVPGGAAAAAAFAGTAGLLWAWWVPAAALSGAWTGLREEGGGDTAGRRAWRLAPLLALAVALPWSPGWPGFLQRVEAMMERGDRAIVEMAKEVGWSGERLAGLERDVRRTAEERRRVLPPLLPGWLFLWMALLVAAGRGFAAHAARVLRWPALSRTPLTHWRLPDEALWTFLAGLALVVLAWAPATPSGWALLLGAGCGYAVQGVAVVAALLRTRGVPSAMVVLSMLFVFVATPPVFVVTAAALGLSDAWLDYRRLEPAADGGEA
jgi:hypothetical protein